MISLKEGEYYVDRRGSVVGPMQELEHSCGGVIAKPPYKLRAPDPVATRRYRYYRADGSYGSGTEAHPYDLVRHAPVAEVRRRMAPILGESVKAGRCLPVTDAQQNQEGADWAFWVGFFCGTATAFSLSCLLWVAL